MNADALPTRGNPFQICEEMLGIVINTVACCNTVRYSTVLYVSCASGAGKCFVCPPGLQPPNPLLYVCELFVFWFNE